MKEIDLAVSFDILRSLEIFLVVADTGSMTTASRRLGVTQSAISQQIKLLEVELGAALFDRQMRPLRLTIAGLTLHQRAGRLVQEAKETWESVRQASKTLLPHLRVAVLSTLSSALVPALLTASDTGKLAVQTISLIRGASRNHVIDLLNREIDVAVTSDALYEHESIDRYELVRERFILLLPKGVAKGSVDLRHLAASLPFLRYTPRIQSGQIIEQHFRRLRLETIPKFSFESPEDLVKSVVAGYGWSVIAPSQLVYSLLTPLAIELFPFPRPGLSRSITLITRKGEFPHIAEQLARLCRDVFRQELVPRIDALMPNIPDAFLLPEDAPAQL